MFLLLTTRANVAVMGKLAKVPEGMTDDEIDFQDKLWHGRCHEWLWFKYPNRKKYEKRLEMFQNISIKENEV
jgi:hypothetical protein